MEGPVDGHSLVMTPSYNRLPATEAPSLATLSHQPLMPEQKQAEPDPTPSADIMEEEGRREYNPEEACIDTNLEDEQEEAESCERGGEELDISFDSQFPDLISDLITEEANPVTAQTPAVTAAPSPAVFPAGVRYMVPPQPSPSSSFLPFPHPLPSSSSSRLASITDFSPEWSYPEVSNQQHLHL